MGVVFYLLICGGNGRRKITDFKREFYSDCIIIFQTAGCKMTLIKASLNTDFNWEIHILPKVGHDHEY